MLRKHPQSPLLILPDTFHTDHIRPCSIPNYGVPLFKNMPFLSNRKTFPWHHPIPAFYKLFHARKFCCKRVAMNPYKNFSCWCLESRVGIRKGLIGGAEGVLFIDCSSGLDLYAPHWWVSTSRRKLYDNVTTRSGDDLDKLCLWNPYKSHRVPNNAHYALSLPPDSNNGRKFPRLNIHSLLLLLMLPFAQQALLHFLVCSPYTLFATRIPTNEWKTVLDSGSKISTTF